MSDIPPPPPSPGLGSRRGKGPKPHPRLPLSAFSPPNTASLESSFPMPASPATSHPEVVIDGNVIVPTGDLNLTQWKVEAGPVLDSRVKGVVLSMPGIDLEKVIKQLESNRPGAPIVSLAIPFDLEGKGHTYPSYLSAASVATSFTTVFNKSTPQGVDSLRWALEHGRPVDIDIQAPISDEVLEAFEDIISKATAGMSKIPPILLSNILPPPHDLELPIVKLMNHPTYLAFQSQVAALSLFPEVYIKFLPPSWDAPIPPTPSEETGVIITDTQQKKEWKRRIKMYLGPVMEAFGYQRIIFGSSPCPTSQGSSIASDWYELARESLSELGVEQDAIDAVFGGNAKKVYGSK